MTYFMIILINYGSSMREIKYPVHNYEHCMEIKEFVKESLELQLDERVRIACPPVQP